MTNESADSERVASCLRWVSIQRKSPSNLTRKKGFYTKPKFDKPDPKVLSQLVVLLSIGVIVLLCLNGVDDEMINLVHLKRAGLKELFQKSKTIIDF